MRGAFAILLWSSFVACLVVGRAALQVPPFAAVGAPVVFDTVTGLEWLTLNVTYRLPAASVRTDMGPGRSLHGWRFASLREVEILWEHAGLPVSQQFSGLFFTDATNASGGLQTLLGAWQHSVGAFVSAGFVEDPGAQPFQLGVSPVSAARCLILLYSSHGLRYHALRSL
jgi:hypothetical protein